MAQKNWSWGESERCRNYISRGSVVTSLRCDGIFGDDSVADLLPSLAVKEF